MTHAHKDPRVRETRRKLQEALVELAAERGYDDVTIGDIAKRAAVNRATFYRHFQDKYDLLEQIFQQEFEQYTRELEPPGQVAQIIDPRNPPERWVRLFQHFAEHKRLYGALLGSRGSSWFVARIRDHFVNLIDQREEQRARLHPLQGKSPESKIPRGVTATLASNLLISTVAWWLESGEQYSPKQIASWFLDLAVNGYVRALGL